MDWGIVKRPSYVAEDDQEGELSQKVGEIHRESSPANIETSVKSSFQTPMLASWLTKFDQGGGRSSITSRVPTPMRRSVF